MKYNGNQYFLTRMIGSSNSQLLVVVVLSCACWKIDPYIKKLVIRNELKRLLLDTASNYKNRNGNEK
jgi:hypothetical protein